MHQWLWVFDPNIDDRTSTLNTDGASGMHLRICNVEEYNVSKACESPTNLKFPHLCYKNDVRTIVASLVHKSLLICNLRIYLTSYLTTRCLNVSSNG